MQKCYNNECIQYSLDEDNQCKETVVVENCSYFKPLDTKIMWICGTYKSGEFPNTVWEFNGIFETKQDAVCACFLNKDFIFPAVVGERAPKESTILPDVEYPNIRDGS